MDLKLKLKEYLWKEKDFQDTDSHNAQLARTGNGACCGGQKHVHEQDEDQRGEHCN